MNLKTFQDGFSLVELMIVIAIIGVISAVSLGSLGVIQKNTRDSQRQSDLRIIQGALQQFYADKNYFPNTLDLEAGDPVDNCTGEGSCSTVTKTYLGATPKDPIGTTSYCYTSYVSSSPSAITCVSPPNTAGVCHYYKLHAMMENSPPGTGTCGTPQVSTYNFELTPL